MAQGEMHQGDPTGATARLWCVINLNTHFDTTDPADTNLQNTKLSLCAVSRSWNGIATPLVYERVIISNSVCLQEHQEKRRKLEALLNAVRRRASKGCNDDDPSSLRGLVRCIALGDLVRRLDLSFPQGSGGTPDLLELERISQTLVELVRKLPNLEVFGVQTSSSLSPLKTFEVLSPQLKHFHWTTDADVVDFGIPTIPFLAFLETHPNLETVHTVFRFDDAAPVSASALHAWSRRALQSVRHWVLGRNQADILAGLPSSIFPNLEGVTFPYYPMIRNNFSPLREFLTVHGRSLTLIHVTPHGLLREMLQAVDPLCPRLREVHLVYTHRLVKSSSIAKASTTISMPRVVTLGLSGCTHSGDLHYDAAHAAKAITLRWTDIFPNLQRIRLLEETDVEALKAIPEKLEEVVRRCRSCGIDLEDNFGYPLTLDILQPLNGAIIERTTR